ncbi:Enamine deaminase RidA, house cleaning of reactive enamine intermediates, YjgF/YER057c/UK114 family [Thermomonospora echinospora]|uniref:Enamine deaminase RidA, house cleaning of reactive enamine intermediates, YjgF/YER057c/UK114 family n=1 Tax=Thermomonospora echinospora TaxID=1992 RepID=A0A1H5SPX9_9ACTN|nr:RidA family protein [Thermomonospora echinospora]SEF52619.1 Enamine deaminase RidA, house cleaning of reactive enamine intermediates, YjgF/YER057c/UK114 family [Thermomonospora echinospora]
MIERISSGGPWEESIGYSRAVLAGDLALVSGCTATVDGEVVHEGDPYEQARTAIRIALGALERLGLSAKDVVRTRMYITRAGDAAEVGRAHGEFFADVRPAASMLVVAGLIDSRMLVEIEMDAYRGGA